MAKWLIRFDGQDEVEIPKSAFCNLRIFKVSLDNAGKCLYQSCIYEKNHKCDRKILPVKKINQ